jgi:hypothetical protein
MGTVRPVNLYITILWQTAGQTVESPTFLLSTSWKCDEKTIKHLDRELIVPGESYII